MSKKTAKQSLSIAIAQFDLTRQLPHLLRRAHFVAEANFASVFGKDLTSRQLAVLVTIARSPDIAQGEMAQTIGLDLNTCSDLVARLVGKNYVERKPSPTDRRIQCLRLTAEGKALVARALPLTAKYQQLVAERLTPEQCVQLIDLLRVIAGFGAFDVPPPTSD